VSTNEAVQDVIDLVEVDGVEASGAMGQAISRNAESIEWLEFVILSSKLSHEPGRLKSCPRVSECFRQVKRGFESRLQATRRLLAQRPLYKPLLVCSKVAFERDEDLRTCRQVFDRALFKLALPR
jgi:hypothetical protein